MCMCTRLYILHSESVVSVQRTTCSNWFFCYVRSGIDLRSLGFMKIVLTIWAVFPAHESNFKK